MNDDCGISRRRFIQVTAVGTAGLLTLRPRRGEAQLIELVGLLAEFALSVGAAVLASSIEDYLRDRAHNDEYRQQIRDTNAALARSGFSDTRNAAVYSSPAATEERTYYRLADPKSPCSSFVAPFYRPECGCQPVAVIEAPHLVGMTLAAQDVRNQAYARDVFIPQSCYPRPQGSLRRGYDRPFQYASAAANVSVDYRPDSASSGWVNVTAHLHNGEPVMVDERWRLQFHGA